MRIKDLTLVRSRAEMAGWPEGKFLIDTVNAHSFVVAQQDAAFAEALLSAGALLPDGISIVKACRWTDKENAPDEKIAGADLFAYEMGKLEERGGVCFFLGSSPETLARLEEKVADTYPHIRVITYSPPYKPVFTAEESRAMVDAVNAARPDLLWVGMTAPKQEKWLHEHWAELDIHGHAGAIGAVFDFFAGTVKRAPQGWIDLGLEWLYRLIQEPRRTWRRYLIDNPRFLWLVLKEKLSE
ncbi:MAG: WecB/TagA/CpsF family glycosyltransferase [Bacteroidales bacterium]|nr:WecB/TagA/CpsF family glycosyltransferase [Bacteroidales bacterium]